MRTSHVVAATESRYQETRRVTLIGAAINILLSILKIVFGVVGHSQALIADGLHSLSDLASDGVVLLAAKAGSRDADEEHPYGHARIETVATVIMGILLLAVAIGIAVDAVKRIMEPSLLLHPGVLALSIAAVSVITKEVLFHYTLRTAKRMRSELLRANAWHHRSDAISSIVVLAGIAGSMAGMALMDAISAMIVALMITKISWDLGWRGIRELVDTGLEPDRLEAIRRLILSVDGVSALHMLRTRRMGANALVDVHILVSPQISVSEGHQISESVRRRLIVEVEEIEDVLVHIDPEDDQKGPPNLDLPARSEVATWLQECCQDVDEGYHVSQVNLHYLNGKVYAEVYLPLSLVEDIGQAQSVAQRIARAAEQKDYIRRVQVNYC